MMWITITDLVYTGSTFAFSNTAMTRESLESVLGYDLQNESKCLCKRISRWCVYTLKQIVVIRRAQSESHSFAGNWTILIKKQEKLGCFIC